MRDVRLGQVEPVLEPLRDGQEDEDARLQDSLRREQILQQRQPHREGLLRGTGLRRTGDMTKYGMLHLGFHILPLKYNDLVR